MNRYTFYVTLLALSFGFAIPQDSNMEKVIYGSMGFAITAVLLILVELFYKKVDEKKEKEAFRIIEYGSTAYLSSLAITNEKFPIIKNCSVELILVNVLNNQGCKTLFSKENNFQKIPVLFVWDNDSPIKDLSNNVPGKMKIAFVTKDEKVILATEKPIDYLYIFPERKTGEIIKKATYQIEIKVMGTIANRADGSDKIVEFSSFWEIGYISKGHFNCQNIWIKSIDKMEETNSLGLGKPFSQEISGVLIIEE